MRRTWWLASLVMLLAVPTSSYAIFGKDDPDKERKELQEARSAALEKLYEEKPEAKAQIKSARGYAVFSTLGINVLLVSTERGGGILHDNGNGKDTYMKMFSAGGGIGMGIKDISLIFIFHTQKALDDFRTAGWDFSGQAEASAETEDDGGGAGMAATVVPGTTIYKLTKTGLALQATLQGTKFWPDDDLN